MKAKTVLRSVMVLIGVALTSGAGGVIIGRRMNAPATVEPFEPSHPSAQVRKPPTLARPTQSQPAKTEIPPHPRLLNRKRLNPTRNRHLPRHLLQRQSPLHPTRPRAFQTLR